MLCRTMLGKLPLVSTVVRQQYHFSPLGATEEIEEYRVELEDVAALELTIIPNLSGGSYASLAQLRLA